MFQANLKLGRCVNREEKTVKIGTILNQLGLTQCLDTRIGAIGQSKGLSGGEKKRLAFATEVSYQMYYCPQINNVLPRNPKILKQDFPHGGTQK